MSDRLAPSVRFVRSLEGHYYLLREAAQMLGVSHRTLRNFNAADPEKLGPGFYAYLGKIKIYLYTDDDIARLRKHLDEQKIVYSAGEPGPAQAKGRPAKWSKEQRQARQRKFSQIHYYKNMAAKYNNTGESDKANRATEKMLAIKQELRDEDQRQSYPEKDE